MIPTNKKKFHLRLPCKNYILRTIMNVGSSISVICIFNIIEIKISKPYGEWKVPFQYGYRMA